MKSFIYQWNQEILERKIFLEVGAVQAEQVGFCCYDPEGCQEVVGEEHEEDHSD